MKRLHSHRYMLAVPLAFGLAVVAACAACAADSPDETADPADPANEPPAGAAAATQPMSPDGWKVWAEGLPEAGVRDRFLAATERMLGTPYENGPLGEGEAGGLDPDPRVDFSRADCGTYQEQGLALALAPPAAAGQDDVRLAARDAIRYRDGQVDFAARNHYMVADWIPANGWLLRDVTAEVAGDRLVEERRTIDRAEFLRGQGAEPLPGRDDAREIAVGVVPVDAIAEVDPNLAAGDLVLWVGGVDGIFVLHTGLAVRGRSGELMFRHASSRAGTAIEEPFADYAASKSFRGFLLLRLRDEPEIPGAAG